MGNVLRFEVAVDKMQALAKYGIVTLSDLQDVRKVFSLLAVLKDALSGIVWTETAADLNRLTDRELKQWHCFSNPKTWEHLGKCQRSRAGKTWEKLLRKYGKPVDLLPLIFDTWKCLFLGEMEAETPQLSYQQNLKSEAEETATILPLVCTVKTLLPSGQNPTTLHTAFLRKANDQANTKQHPETINKIKCCPSCGRDISTQGKRTIFCSENVFGNAAKRCRNKTSNKRRDHKRKILSAMKKNKYLLVPYIDKTEPASDVFLPSKISTLKEWLDRIQSITLISLASRFQQNISNESQYH